MRNRRLIFLYLFFMMLFVDKSFASNVICYDPGTSKVIYILTSVDTPLYESKDCVIYTDKEEDQFNSLKNIPIKYLKFDSLTIVELDQTDKDKVDADEILAQEAAEAAEIVKEAAQVTVVDEAIADTVKMKVLLLQLLRNEKN